MVKFKIKTFCVFLSAIILFCSCLTVITFPEVLAQNDVNQSFAVIMYHHISEDENMVGDYVITPEMFENDLKYLKQKGYKSITVRNLYAINNNERTLSPKSIMITFDDGQESFHKYAFPLLKKYGFSAIFSVIGKYTEMYSNINEHNIKYSHVTWEQIKEMGQSGIVEYGNHSYDMHTNSGVGRLGVTQKAGESDEKYKEAVENDIKIYNDLFEKNLGYKPNFYTYPYGRFSKKTEQIIKNNGFYAAFTCYEKRVVPNSSDDWLYNLGRFNRSGKKTTENFFKSISVV